MRRYLSGLVTVGVCWLSSACASTPVPTNTAAGVEQRQCDTSGAEQEALLRSTQVLSVEPLYAHVSDVGSPYVRLDGVKLVVRPPPGVTAERMTRILQCHSARLLLGQVHPGAVRSDPYWLPDRPLNIDVTPENGNYAVSVKADSIGDNLQVLGHAKDYANDHMMAASPELP